MSAPNNMSAEELRKVFSENLNRLIEKSGHNKIDLANYMGVATSTVSDWCSGKKYPRMDKIEKMAGWFGVLKSDLTEEKDTTAEKEITFDDFTYAFYGEAKELTKENKQKLLEMAKFFKQQQDKEKEERK